MSHSTTIGVDISKDNLDACRLPQKQARQFANTPRGRAALLRWIGQDVVRVVFEPTGHYGRPLARAFAVAGIPAVKVNPRRARRFAEAIGIAAKTDAIDAEVLACMGQLLNLKPQPAMSEQTETLKELGLARRALVKDRTAAKNRAKRWSRRLLGQQTARRLRQIEADIKAIDAEIKTILEQDPDLQRRMDILLSIPGLSTVTAVILLSEMPEIGPLEPKAAASLAGLAPATRQSGRWQGKARIQGGRAELRQALYMPALVAARFNPDMKRLYDRLIENGKPPKVAITAVMRKLVVLANALIAKNQTWTKIYA